ncbi:MAG: SidA/IucD/PvdA family monooxygenase [Candidatus Obscuribacterales bacterium]
MKQPLIVLGAGPKGLAIAAKHYAIGNSDLPPCLLLERDEIGAHWSGKDGAYTDGKQRLVTPPEHDIGYPYKSQQVFDNGAEINQRIQELSWLAYLTATDSLITWINDGRPNPTHVEFVAYLKWVADRIPDIQTKKCDINQIQTDDSGKLWRLSDGNGSEFLGRGLVITGHGGPKRLGGKGYDNDRISDGRNFWERAKAGSLDKFLSERGKTIGVVGSGETAGAIALEILKRIEKSGLDKGTDPVQIILICKRYPGYFLRSDVAKDVWHFSNPVSWDSLNIPKKRAIMQRADRGVVSGDVKHRLERSKCVRYLVADDVRWPEQYPVPTEGPVTVELLYRVSDEEAEDSDKSEKLDLSFLVFAQGFDDLWFLELFEKSLLLKFTTFIVSKANENAITKLVSEGANLWPSTPKRADLPQLLAQEIKNPTVKTWLSRRLEHLIEPDLSVADFEPKIHLPRLAGLRQGPGFPNLNCLGLMSDRIWESYLSKDS